MKVKTSVTLSEEVIKGIDRLSGRAGNRSAVIELAVREYLKAHARGRRNQRDREIYEEHADELSSEATDALRYQIDL